MRFILMQSKGEPPAEKPVGMNDILGIGEYQTAENALRYMRPFGRRFAEGVTHIALYTFPQGYADDCKLVRSIPL